MRYGVSAITAKLWPVFVRVGLKHVTSFCAGEQPGGTLVFETKLRQAFYRFVLREIGHGVVAANSSAFAATTVYRFGRVRDTDEKDCRDQYHSGDKVG